MGRFGLGVTPERSTLAAVRLTRKTGRNGDSEARGLGLDSVRFDTLGLAPDPDEEPDCRYWLGPNLMLSENWFPIPPDLPSLQEKEIRALYDVLLGEQQPDTHGRTPRLLHIAVHHETPVPVVLTLIRVVVPGDRRYSFVGSITLPLAECSWVVKVQSSEGGTTGVRETLAGARFRRANPDLSIEEMRSRFDPYDAHWDSDESDPLTLVRRSTDRLLASLEVDPEVRKAQPFR
jgi:hypothetical protein